jgi:pentatricopeptide repeat protein
MNAGVTVQDNVQQHVATTIKELISKEESWTAHDLRRVERCFKSFSHNPNSLQALAVRQLWERVLAGHVTSEMYSHAIQALAKHGHVDCAKEALYIFVENHTQQTGIQHSPKASHLNAVLQGYAHNKQPEQAESLLQTAFATPKWPTPNIFSVTHVVDAWSRVGNGERAQAILDWVESDGTVELNLVCYNAALTAWARSNDGGRQAEALLRRMPMAPDVISWSAVLTAWASSTRQPQSIQRAEALLWKAYDSGQPLDQSCFNTLLHAFGRQGQIDRAEALLKQWVEMATTESSPRTLVPDKFSFNIILNAIAKSGRNDAGRKAHDLYEKMLEMGVTPDLVTYNSLMNAWAQSTFTVNSNDAKIKSDDSGRQSQALFDDMSKRGVTPDSTTYNSLLNVFAKNGNARQAQKLLDRLERDEWKDQRLSAFVTNQRLIAYNTVLNAWVKSGRTYENDDISLLEAAVNTQAMLQRMRKHGVRPNGISYAAVLNSLQNCGGPDSADMAERILIEMEQDGVKPKKIHYSTVIDTWIHSHEPERAFRVVLKMESILTRMDATGLQVHPAVYVSIIAAFCAQKDPERAEAVLSHIEDSATAPPPTMAAYLATLSAWASSNDPRKALRAWQVLERMRSRVDEKRRSKAIPFLGKAYNIVISACASIPRPVTKNLVVEATEIVCRAFGATPQRDEDTDKNMMQAMRHLISDPNELDTLLRRMKRR